MADRSLRDRIDHIPSFGDSVFEVFHRDIIRVLDAEEHWNAASEARDKLDTIVIASMDGDEPEHKQDMFEFYVRSLRNLDGTFRFSTATKEGIVDILDRVDKGYYGERFYGSTRK